MASTGVVLLCAEDDDLELVRWVHSARAQGLAPEVVAGIEHDDAPLVNALAQTEDALFVVLRSDNLGPERMRAIKGTFARHHRPGQRLVALRLDGSPAAAIERIAVEIRGGLRARSEASLTVALDGLAIGEPAAVRTRLRANTGGLPRAEPDDAVPRLQPSEPTPLPMVIEHVQLASMPSVEHALAFANEAHERETTGRFDLAEETQPTLPAFVEPPREAPPPAAPRRSRLPAVLGAIVAVGGCIGVAAWLLAITGRDADGSRGASDAAGRVSVPSTVEPASPAAREDEKIEADAPSSSTREPARERGSSTRRPRPRRVREHDAPDSPASVEPPPPSDDGLPSEPAPLDPPSEPAPAAGP